MMRTPPHWRSDEVNSFAFSAALSTILLVAAAICFAVKDGRDAAQFLRATGVGGGLSHFVSSQVLSTRACELAIHDLDARHVPYRIDTGAGQQVADCRSSVVVTAMARR
jgi:hypothetical protein